jgi:hypothetical protein
MTRDDIIRMARETGLRPWVVWLIAHRLKFLLFVFWLVSLPLHLIAYMPDAYQDWRHMLKAINRMQVKVIRARGDK